MMIIISCLCTSVLTGLPWITPFTRPPRWLYTQAKQKQKAMNSSKKIIEVEVGRGSRERVRRGLRAIRR